MSTFNLTIVTPAGKAFETPVQTLTAPGEVGSFGVLAHHAPMIAGLKPGIMKVAHDSGISYFVVGEGVLEVNLGNQVMVLVDVAKSATSQDEAENLLAARHVE